MRILLISLFTAAAVLAACSGAPSPNVLATPLSTLVPSPAAGPAFASPTPQPLPPPGRTPPGLLEAEQAAIQALAGASGNTPGQIKVLSAVAVIWPNGCMGVQRLGMMCTQQQVPGYVIVLQAGGQPYEFHTNQDGSLLTPATGVQPSGPASEAVRKHLAAMLGMTEEQISVLSDAEVEWPDSCLGAAPSGMLCAQMVTPGHLFVLQAGGISYEYHTNADGSVFQPGSLLLAWKRTGGIAGFCDEMTVYRSGEVHASSCRAERDSSLNALLTGEERSQLNTWVAQYGQIQIDLSSPQNVSDRMTATLTFQGLGAGQPSSDQGQALYNWAERLYQRLQLD